MRRILQLIGLLAIVGLPHLHNTIVHAEPPKADSLQRSQHARITIETDVDSALVIIDGVRRGTTPLAIDSLPPGVRHVVLQHPDLSNWLSGSLSDSIVVAPGEVRTLQYRIDRRAFITTKPFGAEVFLGDSLYGTTPLLVKVDPSISGSRFSIRKEGYDPVTADLTAPNRGVLALTLQPRWAKEGADGPVLDEYRSQGSRELRLYVSGTATVLSGIAAAYFKLKADDRYTSYSQTGNPSLLSETHRLDTASGIALAITQVGLGLFTYFILSD